MKITDAISGVSKIGIDTAPFIYLVEKHPTYFPLMQTIVGEITNGTMAAFSSTLTLTEVLTLPIKLKKLALANEYEAIFLNTAHFQFVSLDSKIARIAADLRARYNLKTPDAIQVGTSLGSGCQAFLTNDRGLQRITEPPILILDEL